MVLQFVAHRRVVFRRISTAKLVESHTHTHTTLYDFVLQVASLAKDCLCIVDTTRPDVTYALASGCVDILKVNGKEIYDISGKPRDTDLGKCADFLQKLYTLPWVAVTDGAEAAHLFDDNGKSWSFSLPSVKVKNPIGAGDVCTAVLLHRVSQGVGVPEAFHEALAIAVLYCQGDVAYDNEKTMVMKESIAVKIA